MNDSIKVVVRPLGAEIRAVPGQPLSDALVAYGVEFPCGGQGRCRGCRIKVLEGGLAETEADRTALSPAERADGWRLACQAVPTGDLVVELRQWSGVILADDTPFKFDPGSGLGIAVDVGTTTLVAQLLDLATARVLATRTALNPQAKYGSDVMSRVRAALEPGGLRNLTGTVRDEVRRMVEGLLAGVPGGPRGKVARAAIVGNSAMHHFFLGRDPAPFAAYPFEPREPGPGRLRGSELGWPEPAAGAEVVFLPCLGGFVGSDILGVILATRVHESAEVVGGADLGTNGEILIGGRDRIVVASTAAGPAFEGARISQGMRAAPGAIDRVWLAGADFKAHVVGGGRPEGLCGSGLVDAVACGLERGSIEPSGRLPGGSMVLRDPVRLTQQDIRELQLAKGAIAAGIRILLGEFRAGADSLPRFYLAGAFGNNLSVDNTRRIGLLPFSADVIRPAGNAALLGAKMALFLPGLGEDLFASLLARIGHVALDRDPGFQDLFAEMMGFPEKG